LHDICGGRRSTHGVHQVWTELEGGHRLEIVRPRRDLGLDHSPMGIGIWSGSEDPASEPVTAPRLASAVHFP
jgi:hypothetical protein